MRIAIKSIESLLVGSRSKGQLGENIVAEALSVFPQDMLEKNFRINNNPVEFALRLPNNKVLPIDSKFSRTDLVELLQQEDDEEKRSKIINESGIADISVYAETFPAPKLTTPHIVALVTSNRGGNTRNRERATHVIRVITSGDAQSALSKAVEVLNFFIPDVRPYWNSETGFKTDNFFVMKIFQESEPGFIRNINNIFLAEFTLRFLTSVI